MNILLLGSGGREHALAWKLAASPLVERLLCAPGNAGIARDCKLVALDIADHAAVIAFCKAQKIDLVVVGPEAPLCAGIVDDLTAAGIKAFGPTRAAAQLEGSKGFTKDLCKANKIPTAAYERFNAAAAAKCYMRARGALPPPPAVQWLGDHQFCFCHQPPANASAPAARYAKPFRPA